MSPDLGDDEVYCRDCGEIISARAEICPECGVRQREPESKTDRDPGIAAVASFLIPGLGQVYNGQLAKGIILGIVTVGLAISVVGLIVAVPMWIWLVYDAYKTAENPDRGSSGRSEGSQGPPRTRTIIERSLDWWIEHGDDPDRARAVRKRFRGSSIGELSEEDRRYIHSALEEYEENVPGGGLSDVKQELRF